MAILSFSGLVISLAYAQSYSSSSSNSNATCCCCCLPVILILVVLWLNSKSKSRTPHQPAVVEATVTPQQPVQVVYKEKETIREIVKVRCEYCGTLVDITGSRCPSCGAPLKP
jgi:hypothetical protein